jgi:hypothetical protein
MRISIKPVLAALLLTSLSLSAQEKGAWRAASNSAKTITGDVALADEKILINGFYAFTMVRVRNLEATETSSIFGLDSNGTGGLYRIEIPATQKFLHKNTLCGTDETHWMAAFASGRTLQLAFFSSQKPPVFTPDAIANSSDLCGTYSYSK